MPEQDPVAAMATSYTAAWCSQDPSAVAAHFAEDGSLTINNGAPAVGRAAIADSARAFMTSLPDIVVAMDGLRMDGRSARYELTLTNSPAVYPTRGTDAGCGA